MRGQGLIRRLGGIVPVPANSHLRRQGITFTPPCSQQTKTQASKITGTKTGDLTKRSEIGDLGFWRARAECLRLVYVIPVQIRKRMVFALGGLSHFLKPVRQKSLLKRRNLNETASLQNRQKRQLVTRKSREAKDLSNKEPENIRVLQRDSLTQLDLG